MLTEQTFGPPSLGWRNSILSNLGAADAAQLAQHFQLVDLPREHRLERRGHLLEHLYFIESGIACVIAGDGDDAGVAVAMIGSEAFVGVSALLGTSRSGYDVRMVAPGAALRIPIPLVRRAMDSSPVLQKTLIRFGHDLMLQAMREAQIAARATLEVRLERLLLKLHDRALGSELRFTHERLATLLGVRRAGVTVALKKLENAGVIASRRSVILIQAREQLENRTGNAYGAEERSIGITPLGRKFPPSPGVAETESRHFALIQGSGQIREAAP